MIDVLTVDKFAFEKETKTLDETQNYLLSERFIIDPKNPMNCEHFENTKSGRKLREKKIFLEYI